MSEDSSKSGAGRGKLVPPVLLLLAGLAYGGYTMYRARQPYEWSGTGEARLIQVGSRAGGRVKAVLAREGESVKAGQPLLELEPADLPAQLMQAQGALAQVQANLEKIERGARPEEIAAARARSMTASAA